MQLVEIFEGVISIDNFSLSLYHCEVLVPEDSGLQMLEQLECQHRLPLLLSWTPRALKDLEPNRHPCSRSSASPRSCTGCCIVPAASCPPLPGQTGGTGRPEGTKEADGGPAISSCRGEIERLKLVVGQYSIHPSIQFLSQLVLHYTLDKSTATPSCHFQSPS